MQTSPPRQQGATLLIMLVILVMGATAMLLKTLNSTTTRLAREKITADVLAQAKEALIGYAASVDLSSNRLGDLPCPDMNNDGVTDSPCGNAAGTTGQTLRLGRLPWKSLGLPDLRDGSGERLWYAVSNNFKKSTRTALLNSDTPGTITVRTPDGSLLNDASNANGAVAIIIAPGEVLTRQGSSTAQDRSIAGINNPINYLDVANGEDNADFIDGASNGFIQGTIKDSNDKLLLNDRIIVITQDNIMLPIQKRVAKEISIALDVYYSYNHFYPSPAAFTDVSCLGSAILASCNSAASTRGRIPANPATPWLASSILKTTSTGNWFQNNAWREVFLYAVASACTNGTSNCNGTGYLTLNNPPSSPSLSNKVILIAAGGTLSGQSRADATTKTLIGNYLEDENLAPLNDIYTKNAAQPFNDIATSIP